MINIKALIVLRDEIQELVRLYKNCQLHDVEGLDWEVLEKLVLNTEKE
jgi:hypothetical protein